MVQLVTWNDFGEGTIVEPTLEFGYRDLGVVQDFRRQYINAGFAPHTNDLALAFRYYNLRKLNATNATVSAELARAFTNIVSGNLAAASLQLAGLEAGAPVIHTVSLTNGNFRFLVGGYIPGSGAEIQTTSNLGAAWQTVNAIPASTNPAIYTTPVLPGASAFFKVRASNP